MSGPPEKDWAALAGAAHQTEAADQSDYPFNTRQANFQQAELIAAAARHVLALGERVSLEFLKDLSLNRNVEETCRDFRRIDGETYNALVAGMSAPFVGDCQ